LRVQLPKKMPDPPLIGFSRKLDSVQEWKALEQQELKPR
jgi:hypothetical protein